jgi:hypothetical protein
MTATTTTKKAAAAAPSIGIKEAYLLIYNGVCCLGWAYVLALGLPTLYRVFMARVSNGSSDGGSIAASLKFAMSTV